MNAWEKQNQLVSAIVSMRSLLIVFFRNDKAAKVQASVKLQSLEPEKKHLNKQRISGIVFISESSHAVNIPKPAFVYMHEDCRWLCEVTTNEEKKVVRL